MDKGILIVLLLLLSGTMTVAEPDELVQVTDDDGIWPYYSKAPSTAGQTSALNIIVNQSSDTFITALKQNGWTPAEGADRYSYVLTNGEGAWSLPDQYQYGTYHGQRYDLRLYHGDDWSGGQVHIEYWNWFTLRHTPYSNEKAQQFLIEQFNTTATISEIYHPVDDIRDHDGWLAVITMLILAVPFRKIIDHMPVRSLTLFGSLFTLIHGSRFLAGAVTYVTGIDPQLIGGGFYLLIAVGIPSIITYGQRSWSLHPLTAGFVLSTVLLLDFISVNAPLTTELVQMIVLIGAGGILTCRDNSRTRTRLMSAGPWVLILGLFLIQYLP